MSNMTNETELFGLRNRGCRGTMFRCRSDNRCIYQRFVCDGKPDCSDHSDEHLFTCKGDVCAGKIRCVNGRCIDPSACCDPKIDSTCDRWRRAQCCDDRFNSLYGSGTVQTPSTIGEAFSSGSLTEQSAMLLIITVGLVIIGVFVLIVFVSARFLVRKVRRNYQRGTPMRVMPNSGITTQSLHLPESPPPYSAESDSPPTYCTTMSRDDHLPPPYNDCTDNDHFGENNSTPLDRLIPLTNAHLTPTNINTTSEMPDDFSKTDDDQQGNAEQSERIDVSPPKDSPASENENNP